MWPWFKPPWPHTIGGVAGAVLKLIVPPTDSTPIAGGVPTRVRIVKTRLYQGHAVGATFQGALWLFCEQVGCGWWVEIGSLRDPFEEHGIRCVKDPHPVVIYGGDMSFYMATRYNLYVPLNLGLCSKYDL